VLGAREANSPRPWRRPGTCAAPIGLPKVMSAATIALALIGASLGLVGGGGRF
jgi:hypothetical protein